jgi:hypothetical protein
MNRLLHLGARSYEVEWAAAVSGAGAVLDRPRVLGAEAALVVLRRALREAPGHPVLGRLLEDILPGARAHLDDDEVLALLGSMLRARRLLVREQPVMPLAGFGAEPVADAGAVEPPQPAVARPARTELTWIEIQLIGEDNQPIPGERYRIELTDGSVREGRLNEEGLARVDGIDPGQCQVTFPALDEEAWVPA